MPARIDGSSVRKLRIMMLGLRSLGSGQGGVEAHVLQLATEIDRLGHSVEAIVRSPYAGSSPSTLGREIRVRPLWSPRHQATEALIHSILGVLYAAVRRPDVLHIHAIGPALVTPLARALGLRVVVTHHGEDYRREKWGWFARKMLLLGERFGAYLASRRICVSPSLAAALSEKYDRSYDYIPNGVRALERVDTAECPERLGLEPGRYILHVGRLVPEKRQLDLIELIDRIGERHNLRLALVGAADHESAFSREVVARAARSPRTVLCGFQSNRPLAELFSHCAVFVLPSTHEGLPIALLEAMSYGCRVVASDIEANLNVGLGDAAYFRTGDLCGLERAVEHALTLPTPVNWKRKLAPFNWNEIASETLRVYEDATR